MLSVLSSASLSGCQNQGQTSVAQYKDYSMSKSHKGRMVSSLDNFDNVFHDNIVWAFNIGGESYTATNGVLFSPYNPDFTTLVGHTDTVLGSQDKALYQTFAEGDFNFERTLENGTYDVTLLFAEPYDTPVGERVFDVIINNETVLKNVDVRGMRDGKAFSALDKTFSKIEVNNGSLSIKLQATKGVPIVSGLIVRKHHANAQQWQLVWQDEFDYEGSPDSSKWNFDQWPARKVNDEDQVYTNRQKNVRVENGTLIIEAHKEQYDNGEYTSGRIHTLDKADMLYGRIDVKLNCLQAEVPGRQSGCYRQTLINTQALANQTKTGKAARPVTLGRIQAK